MASRLPPLQSWSRNRLFDPSVCEMRNLLLKKHLRKCFCRFLDRVTATTYCNFGRYLQNERVSCYWIMDYSTESPNHSPDLQGIET